jgi:hypothetical protein
MPPVPPSSFRTHAAANRRCRVLQLLQKKTCWAWLLNVCLIVAGCRLWWEEGPSTAFFYGHPIPSELFQRYQRVVIEADNLRLDELPDDNGAEIFAYLSVGEAERWRAGYERLQKQWFLGVNSNWNSDIADLTAPGWRHYLLDERMATLWELGYRGFFLDTLDSYRLALTDPAAQAAQKDALVSLIQDMHQRFPGIQLIFNRGFDLLPDVGNLAAGIVAESLYYTWDPATQRYKEVNAADRNWLLEHLRYARRHFGLPVTIIDYLPPDQRVLARKVAEQIAELGFTPWIAPPSLDVIGIGKADLATK